MLYLGQAIRIIRNKFNETQLTMAKKLNISNVYLCLVEANKRGPSIELIGKIQETYGHNAYLLAYLLEKGKDSTIKEIKKLHLLRIEDYSGTETSNSQFDT